MYSGEVRRRGQHIALTGACLVTLLGSSRFAAGDPITFVVQPPLVGRDLMVAERGSWELARKGPAPEHADDATLVLTTLAAVALHERLTAMVMLGHLWRTAELSAPTGDRVERSASGFGDITLLLSGVAYNGGLSTGELVVAPIAGVKFPTGAHDDSDHFGRLPQRLQVGTGALDIVAGAVASWRRAPWSAYAATTYLLRTRAHDFEAGDELRLDAAAHRCVAPWSGCDRSAQRLFAVVESHLTYQAADRGRLAPVESGGVRWYVAPGMRWQLGRHVLEVAVELPLLQPVDRHIDFVARAGYRFMVD